MNRHFVVLSVICLFFIFFLPTQSQGQGTPIDTNAIRKASRKAPRRFTRNPADLANYLTRYYGDEESKALALSYWIAKNIKYNLKAYTARDIKRRNSLRVLKKRRALCGEYAQLFKEMCASVGLEAEVVKGYTWQVDFLPGDTLYRAEHAWNVVRVNGTWQLMDITYGSGYIKPKKQIFRRLLWRYFKINFFQKWKYVHEFNPAWFNVAPRRMVMTHLPVIPVFQLLPSPLPIDSFAAGQIASLRFLNAGLVGSSDGASLDAHMGSEQLDRWLAEGRNGHRFNPKNRRITGLDFLLVADSLRKKHYNKNNGLIAASKPVLERINNYCLATDSLLALSMQDNATEFEHYKRRSKEWETELKTNDKRYSRQLKTLVRSNKRQIKHLRRAKRKNKSLLKAVPRIGKAVTSHNLDQVRRPGREKSARPEISQQELRKAARYYDTASVAVQVIDSVFAVHPKRELLRLTKIEEDLYDTYKFNLRSLRGQVNLLDFMRPDFHVDDTYLVKPWLEETLLALDSASLELIAPVLATRYTDQKLAYDAMKNYTRNMKRAVKALGKAKRRSIIDLGEAELHQSYVEDYKTTVSNYKAYMKDFMEGQKGLRWYLKKEIKKAKAYERSLQKDMKIEGLRHKRYTRYRKFIQQAENRRMKYVLTASQSLQRQVARSIRMLEKSQTKDGSGGG